MRRNLWGAQLEAAGLTGGGFWTRPPVETPAGARAGRQVTVEVLDGELDGETLGGHPNPAINGHLKTGHLG